MPAKFEDEVLFKTFHKNDPFLLRDLTQMRSQDAPALLQRVDKAIKGRQPGDTDIPSPEDVKAYISCLVDCYFCTAETIKVSRMIEKLWKPFEARNRNWIVDCMERNIHLIIQSSTPEQTAVVRVSVLMEQNKLIQSIVKRTIVLVCSWVAGLITSLQEIPPQKLTRSQSLFLYAVVKICLQLFQTCPTELGSKVWSDTGGPVQESDLPICTGDTVQTIVAGLVHVLTCQGYGLDCVLLSGTAVSLVLKAAPDILSLVTGFNNLLSYILKKESNFSVAVLRKAACSWVPVEEFRQGLKLSPFLGLAAVALIRGIVACGTLDQLLSQTRGREGNIVFMFQLYELLYVLCEGDITLHYHAFQALLLWFSKLTKATSRLESVKDQLSDVYTRTVQLVLLNWDSPVEDVPEDVVAILSAMLDVWTRCPASISDLPQQIIDRLLQAHWYIKGKYRVLAALLKYVNADKILADFPAIQEHLLKCLTTSHLTSSATNVYRSFLQHIKKQSTCEGDSVENWRQSWLSIVVQGLTSTNSLLRHNVSLHWVPVTLQVLPSAGSCVQGHLSGLIDSQETNVCRVRLLHAWVAVTRTIRIVTGTVNLTSERLREALFCTDEDVRAEAFTVICTTLKTIERLSDVEVTLLKESLPYNIKVDSTPLRQHLMSDMKRLLVRLRDSSLYMLKSPETNTQFLETGVEFVEWLHTLCMDYLLPGACYQRRKGSLDLLHVLYDTLIHCPDNGPRKGGNSDNIHKLAVYVEGRGSWNFFTMQNAVTLLHCLLDGADEIQTSAAELLARYYPLPLGEKSVTPEVSLPCHLLSEGLRLCNSPKGHESQSGVALCHLVYKKYVVSRFCQFDFKRLSNGEYHVTMETTQADNNAVRFLQGLLSEVKRCLIVAEDNLVIASKTCPIHGLISAFTKCLTETQDVCKMSNTELLPLIEDLIDACGQIIDKMLGIMARVAGQEACPSFADIGIALETLLEETQSDYSKSAAQSADYQYLLSWCWNNIKDCCVCLGDVTWSAMTPTGPLLTTATVRTVSSLILTVLTKCRHKGVIEGCGTAFTRFCSALYQSSDSSLQEVPDTILTEVLLSLKTNVMSNSVTRRSAGLPLIVLSVLASERKLKKKVLLMKAVDELFEVSSKPLSDESDGRLDLPQVHGLNILNSLFSDAGLTSSLIAYISRAVILVIQKFGSPSWAIRNAATRLFSTLVTRLFGQKGGEDITRNSVTFQEFNARYPELPPFLLEVLKEAAQSDVMAITQLHPGLFPVLTILAGLKPVESHDQHVISLLKQFEERIIQFLASPVYQLRHLAASSMVAMVAIPAMTTLAVRSLEMYIAGARLDYNQAHGHLLLVSKLLVNVQSTEDLQRILTSLLELDDLIVAEVPSMLKAQYLRTLTTLVERCPDVPLPDTLLKPLESQLHTESQGKEDVCDCLLSGEAVHWLFTVAGNQSGGEGRPLVAAMLQSQDVDVRKACLSVLDKQLKAADGQEKWSTEKLQTSLVDGLSMETHIPNLTRLLELVLRLHTEQGTSQEDIQKISHWLSANQQTVAKYTSLSAAALPVRGICIQQCIQDQADRIDPAMAQSWCDQVCQYSDTSQNETRRTAAVRSLLQSGGVILQLAAVERVAWLEACSVRLISACLTLIQDENTEIRGLAAQFINTLDWPSKYVHYPSVQSNVCYEMLLDFIALQFGWSCDCVQLLWEQLYRPESLPVLLKQRAETRFQQLFDQEDNSFFAERLYNALCLHRTIKKILREGEGRCHGFITGGAELVVSDLEVLHEMLVEVKPGSVIHQYIDGTVLASLCSLVLQAHLVTMTTGSAIYSKKLSAKLADITSMNVLPSNLRHQLNQSMEDR